MLRRLVEVNLTAANLLPCLVCAFFVGELDLSNGCCVEVDPMRCEIICRTIDRDAIALLSDHSLVANEVFELLISHAVPI